MRLCVLSVWRWRGSKGQSTIKAFAVTLVHAAERERWQGFDSEGVRVTGRSRRRSCECGEGTRGSHAVGRPDNLARRVPRPREHVRHRGRIDDGGEKYSAAKEEECLLHANRSHRSRGTRGRVASAPSHVRQLTDIIGL